MDFENNACGVGLIANINGIKSKKIYTNGLKILKNLDHRGGTNPDTGISDGSGLMLEIPHEFFSSIINLPKSGKYACGNIFFSNNSTLISEQKLIINKVLPKYNLKLITYRLVPINKNLLITETKAPHIEQIFIENLTNSRKQFEKNLYFARKEIEKKINSDFFHITSLSSYSIIYKGLLSGKAIPNFYLDLNNKDIKTSFMIVHSRFSTNTSPNWKRSHPFRFLAHNGEINTINSNIHFVKLFKDSLKIKTKILDNICTDSSILDNFVEYLYNSGLSLHEIFLRLIIPNYYNDIEINKNIKNFFRLNELFFLPWDGPSAIVYSDGKDIGAILDKNGLRPLRYILTKQNILVLSSETGVIKNLKFNDIIQDGKLNPCEMILIKNKKLCFTKDIYNNIDKSTDYIDIIKNKIIYLNEIKIQKNAVNVANLYVNKTIDFNYLNKDITTYFNSIFNKNQEPTGAMGNDIALPFLNFSYDFFDYFKQTFAQVTNPPIDPIREATNFSTKTILGKKNKTNYIELDSPILSTIDFIKLISNLELKYTIVDICFHKDISLKFALEEICKKVENLINDGNTIIILTDINLNKKNIQIPSLLCLSALNTYLNKKNILYKCNFVLAVNDAWQAHHISALLSFGASAVYPYWGLNKYTEYLKKLNLTDQKKSKYLNALNYGVLKIMSKCGITNMLSYINSYKFEILGLSKNLSKKYFNNVTCNLNGLNLNKIEFLQRQKQDLNNNINTNFLLNKDNAILLNKACKTNDYSLYKEFTNEILKKQKNIRSLFELQHNPIPIKEVETEENIIKRFKIAAMSYGALSKKAHETIALAMNSIGLKSNCGEGGELPTRYNSKYNSEIKQVASGRFGVTIQYLNSAKEIEIKICQGAKPGEGGQLSASKVDSMIAKARNCNPNTDLISPPPHHDIYSIEDLKQLIFDLRCSNPKAEISVKLASEYNVGIIASGVAKAQADIITICGQDGGTGSAFVSSIKNTGTPWELGLAYTHNTLKQNNLREFVTLAVDGKLLSGYDIIIASILGAEQFCFGTAALIALGCIMDRHCNLNNCSVGITTQNKNLCKNFKAIPQDLINYMNFVAKDVREIMSKIGIKSIDKLVGNNSVLKTFNMQKYHLIDLIDNTKNFDVSKKKKHKVRFNILDYKIIKGLQNKNLLKETFIEKYKIKNTDRTIGTLIGNYVINNYLSLKEDTIKLLFEGNAGQSFGAFIPKGLTLELTGTANDYVGKGLSGGKIIIKNPTDYVNVLAGNVVLYGATSGETYISGTVGERFCVRNSGATAVVEGTGNHACEYMTSGSVVIIGETGTNIAAGMSGGVIYLYTKLDKNILNKINKTSVGIYKLTSHYEKILLEILNKHFNYTNSKVIKKILNNWKYERYYFVNILPLK